MTQVERDFSKLPGPDGLPLLGSVVDLLSRKDLHRVLMEWGEQYGGLYKFSVFGKPTVVVSDVELLDELLAPPPEGVPKNLPLYGAINNISSPVSHNNLITYGDFDQWKHVRESMDPSFAPESLSSIFPTIKEELSGVIAQLRMSAADGQKEVLVNAGDWCVRVALNTVGNLAYTLDLGLTDDLSKESPLIKAMERARIVETNRAKNPLSKLTTCIPFLDENKKHAADLKLIHSVFASAGDRVRALKCPVMAAKEKSISCALHNLTDWRTGQPLDKDALDSNIGVLAGAGSFPAALIATYALYEIAAHPPVQNRIEAELAEAGLLGKPEDIPFESMGKLKFLNAAVKEATRFHPIVPQVQRVADRDLVLKGYKIPKGTPFFVSIGTVHNSSNNYTEPDKYWPERWEYTKEQVKEEFGKNGSTATPIGNINNIPGSFIPFSAGNRNCLGRHVAWLQATSIVAHLVSNFRISLDSTTSSQPKEIIKEEYYATTLNPGKPINLRLSLRT